MYMAAADSSISAVQFLPIALSAIKFGADKLRHLAADVLIQKVASNLYSPTTEFQQELTALESKRDVREYVACLISIGELFLAEGEERDRQLAKNVLWLQQRDASDPVLGLPYCVDVNGQPWCDIADKWEELITNDDTSAALLGNAAEFFLLKSPRRAKELFVKCGKLQPNASWEVRIAEADTFIAGDEGG